MFLPTKWIYLERKADADVGQDGDGGKGDQRRTNQMTRDPAGHEQGQGASASPQLLQVEGHAAKREREANNQEKNLKQQNSSIYWMCSPQKVEVAK